MIKQILNEYRERYASAPKNLAGLAAAASRAHLHLSARSIRRLKALAAEEFAPIKVGVIGQFSSGKSTLLNLFLPEPALATGARPTSAIAVFIKQGDFKILERRADEFIETSTAQNDQNSAAPLADELHIFSPCEHLANLELIDTPGLNANAADERMSEQLFERFDAVVWLSQAMAAGKASEKAAIAKLPAHRRICLLTQADLLDAPAAQQALNFARANFGELFEGVHLFSAKWAKEGQKNSGFAELLGFLRSLGAEDKRAKIRANLEEILGQIRAQTNACADDLRELEQHLALAVKSAKSLSDADVAEKLAADVLAAIKQSAAAIAGQISAALRDKTGAIYTPARGMLGKNRFERREYSYKTLRPSDVAAEIFYNNDAYARELKGLQRSMAARFEGFAKHSDELFCALEAELLRERTRVLGTAQSAAVSEQFVEAARRYFKDLRERTCGEFARASEKFSAQVTALGERLAAKALGNFEAAVALTCGFFYEKITVSREFYEQNSVEFKLYVPSAAEIERRLLGDLCFYEFEEILVNKRALERLQGDLAAGFEGAAAVLSEQIREDVAALLRRADEIEKMFKSVEF